MERHTRKMSQCRNYYRTTVSSIHYAFRTKCFICMIKLTRNNTKEIKDKLSICFLYLEYLSSLKL